MCNFFNRTDPVVTYRHNARFFISYKRSGYTYSFNVSTIIGPTKERLFFGFKDIFKLIVGLSFTSESQNSTVFSGIITSSQLQ